MNEVSEYTVLGIKPTAVVAGQVEPIVREIQKENFKILEGHQQWLSFQEAGAFYDGHRLGKELVIHATSGPWNLFILQGEDAMRRMRILMGNVPLLDRPARGIRGDFGFSRIENAVHAPKDEKELEQHLSLFFPNFHPPEVKVRSCLPKPIESRGEKIGCHGRITVLPEEKVVEKAEYWDSEVFPDSLYREYLVLRSISGLGIAPKPIDYLTKPAGIDRLHMELVEGKHWADLSENEKVRLLPEIATALKKLHQETQVSFYFESAGDKSWGNFIDCFEDNIILLEKFASQCKYWEALNFIRRHKDRLLLRFCESNEFPSRFSLIHFDISPGNLLFDNKGEVKLIDWGSAHFNDPALDIARAMVKLGIVLDKEKAASFLESYGVTEKLKQRIACYLPFACLSVAISRAESPNEPLPTRASLRNLSKEKILQLANLQMQEV